MAGKSAGAGAGADGAGDPEHHACGRGYYDPETGLYDYYEHTACGQSGTPQGGLSQALTWADLLAQWDRIECDLHEVYGLDVLSGILDRRPAGWLKKRIAGLLLRESRTQAYFARKGNDRG